MRVGAIELIKRRRSWRSILATTAIMLAAASALIPLPAAWVERFYSNGLYPRLQHLLTPVANALPFTIVDALLIAVIIGLPVWWGIRLARAGRGRRLGACGRLAVHTLGSTALVFLSFQVFWGFNYLREPLVSRLEYDGQRLTTDGLKRLNRLSVERLNAESTEVHTAPWPVEEEWRERLHASFNAVLAQLGHPRGITPAEPKTSLLDGYLGAAGINGFMNPFGHEIILGSDVLPFEKPFLLAHEWAHLAGFADEAEASFVGLLACLQSNVAAIRYSAWLALYRHVPVSWSAGQSEDAAAQVELPPRPAAGVMADLRAIDERLSKRTNPGINRFQAGVYDRFLKANRVEAGVGSYGQLVHLVLGARFEPDWVPVRRGMPATLEEAAR
jgi:uncharacterized protein DUF3810